MNDYRQCGHPRCDVRCWGVEHCSEHETWAEGAAYGRCQAGGELVRICAEVERLRDGIRDAAEHAREGGIDRLADMLYALAREDGGGE